MLIIITYFLIFCYFALSGFDSFVKNLVHNPTTSRKTLSSIYRYVFLVELIY